MKIFLIAIILVLNSIIAHAQQIEIIKFTVSDRVRDSLAKVWDEKDPQQVEHGYCGAYTISMEMDRRMHYAIDSLIPPDSVDDQTQISIRFWCPRGSIDIHTHTPTTCEYGRDSVYTNTCVLGGEMAWLCAPSPGDYQYLFSHNYRFGLIQCDKHAIILFVNFHWNPDAKRPGDGWIVKPDTMKLKADTTT